MGINLTNTEEKVLNFFLAEAATYLGDKNGIEDCWLGWKIAGDLNKYIGAPGNVRGYNLEPVTEEEFSKSCKQLVALGLLQKVNTNGRKYDKYALTLEAASLWGLIL